MSGFTTTPTPIPSSCSPSGLGIGIKPKIHNTPESLSVAEAIKKITSSKERYRVPMRKSKDTNSKSKNSRSTSVKMAMASGDEKVMEKMNKEPEVVVVEPEVKEIVEDLKNLNLKEEDKDKIVEEDKKDIEKLEMPPPPPPNSPIPPPTKTAKAEVKNTPNKRGGKSYAAVVAAAGPRSRTPTPTSTPLPRTPRPKSPSPRAKLDFGGESEKSKDKGKGPPPPRSVSSSSRGSKSGSVIIRQTPQGGSKSAPKPPPPPPKIPPFRRGGAAPAGTGSKDKGKDKVLELLKKDQAAEKKKKIKEDLELDVGGETTTDDEFRTPLNSPREREAIPPPTAKDQEVLQGKSEKEQVSSSSTVEEVHQDDKKEIQVQILLPATQINLTSTQKIPTPVTTPRARSKIPRFGTPANSPRKNTKVDEEEEEVSKKSADVDVQEVADSPRPAGPTFTSTPKEEKKDEEEPKVLKSPKTTKGPEDQEQQKRSDIVGPSLTPTKPPTAPPAPSSVLVLKSPRKPLHPPFTKPSTSRSRPAPLAPVGAGETPSPSIPLVVLKSPQKKTPGPAPKAKSSPQEEKEVPKKPLPPPSPRKVEEVKGDENQNPPPEVLAPPKSPRGKIPTPTNKSPILKLVKESNIPVAVAVSVSPKVVVGTGSAPNSPRTPKAPGGIPIPIRSPPPPPLPPKKKILVPCRYQSSGCPVTFDIAKSNSTAEAKYHQDHCPRRSFTCYMMSCFRNALRISYQTFMDHMLKDHFIPQSFEKDPPISSVICTDVFLVNDIFRMKMLRSHCLTFLLMLTHEKGEVPRVNGVWRMWFYVVDGEEEDAPKFRYSLKVCRATRVGQQLREFGAKGLVPQPMKRSLEEVYATGECLTLTDMQLRYITELEDDDDCINVYFADFHVDFNIKLNPGAHMSWLNRAPLGHP